MLAVPLRGLLILNIPIVLVLSLPRNHQVIRVEAFGTHVAKIERIVIRHCYKRWIVEFSLAHNHPEVRLSSTERMIWILVASTHRPVPLILLASSTIQQLIVTIIVLCILTRRLLIELIVGL